METATKALTSAMKTSIFDVLETMFFLPVDVSESGIADRSIIFDPEKTVASRLDFDGPLSGHFDFLVPENLALSLTANFLGQDESRVSPDQAIETVKEITNMIAGNTFSIFNPRAVFNLDIPQMGRVDGLNMDHPGSETDICVLINTLDGCLMLRLMLRPDASA